VILAVRARRPERTVAARGTLPRLGGPFISHRQPLMGTKIDTRRPYRAQLDRVRRFHERMLGKFTRDRDFEDIATAFFQNCWLLYESIRMDETLPLDARRSAVLDAARVSPLLKIARDLCNGAKHLRLDKPGGGAGATHHHVGLSIFSAQKRASEWECYIHDGTGQVISGQQLARDCVTEWESILEGNGFEIAPVD